MRRLKDSERLYNVVKKRFPCLKKGLNVKKAQDASKLIRTRFVLHNVFVVHDIEDGKWTESGASNSELAADNYTPAHGGLIEKGKNPRTDTLMSSLKEQQDEYRRLELALMRYIFAKHKK
jgi:hypothetical protein